MNKSAWKIAKLNLQNLKAVFYSIGVTAALVLIQTIIYMILGALGIYVADGEQSTVSPFAFGWILIMVTALVVPLRNFRRVVNLGGKRDNFLLGTLMLYALLAAFAALFNTIGHYTFDRYVQNGGFFPTGLLGGIMNPIEVFGWTAHGAVLATLQQFALLFLMASAIHTLVSAQDKWYGWVADVVLVVILSVFIPVAVLRPVLLGFFWLVIFQPYALLQILACLVLGIGVYALNRPIYARKVI